MRIVKPVIFFLFFSLFSSLAHSTGRFGINAYQAGQVVCHANNQYKSTFFLNSNGNTWIEKTADGQRFHWQQAMRDEWSIYLSDQSRGYVMQIDLHTSKVTYGRSGNRQQYDLCNIVSASTAQPVPPPKPKNLGQYCAKENQRCNYNGIAVIKYGANNRWTSKQLQGPVNCNNRTFGDPAPGIAKACFFTMVNQPPPNNLGQFCASENQVCNFSGKAIVNYGANNRWVTRQMNGPVICNNRTFGEPTRDVKKACYYRALSNPNPNPNPNPTPRPRPTPVDDGSQYDISEKTLAGMSRNKTNQLVKWAIAESMRQEQPMCWKKSKPNTAGKPLSSCPSGKRKEGLLCYKNCRNGYRSDGAMLCYKKCPKGTNTSPGFCHFKFGSIGGCPSPLKGLKPACMNTNSYSRGVGTPMVCAKGQVQKGALCYPKCPGGYAHGGPVCWQQCSGSHPVDCGAGCAQSTGKCVSEVANMVLATGELVANIAGMALTGGTANAGINTAKTAARTGQKVAAKIALKKALQSARGAVRDKLTTRLGSRVLAYVAKKNGRRAGDKLVRDYAKMVLENAAQKILISQVSQDPSLAEIASMIDPTGVVDVVNAYNKPICEPLPMPR